MLQRSISFTLCSVHLYYDFYILYILLQHDIIIIVRSIWIS
nr:MAG TPA: hypothetical protein [Caudoviricetes sp.]